MKIYNKEAVYDDQIAPLMQQIIEICKKEGVQMVASFALIEKDPDMDGGYSPLLCTSYTNGHGYNSPNLIDARYVCESKLKAVSPAVFDCLQGIKDSGL